MQAEEEEEEQNWGGRLETTGTRPCSSTPRLRDLLMVPLSSH